MSCGRSFTPAPCAAGGCAGVVSGSTRAAPACRGGRLAAVPGLAGLGARQAACAGLPGPASLRGDEGREPSGAGGAGGAGKAKCACAARLVKGFNGVCGCRVDGQARGARGAAAGSGPWGRMHVPAGRPRAVSCARTAGGMKTRTPRPACERQAGAEEGAARCSGSARCVRRRHTRIRSDPPPLLSAWHCFARRGARGGSAGDTGRPKTPAFSKGDSCIPAEKQIPCT